MKDLLFELINIEDLLGDNIEKIKDAIRIIQKARYNISALQEKEDKDNSILRVGTTLTIAILNKIEEGKLPTDFSAEDWEEILDYVSEYAIEADDTAYSAYVFMLYAWYIEKSVNQMSGRLSDVKAEAILALSDELKLLTTQLANEEIREVDYIQQSLWICLEAMIKLISGTIDTALGFDKDNVVEAAAMLAMEYGRFVLYKREHELLTEYLKNQKILDVELAMQYDEYLEELNAQASQFEMLIDKAFEPNFDELLINSVMLARAAGVEEEEILKTTSDVDDYFM